jgi:hypothetical protein
LVTARQQPFDLLRRKRLGQLRQPPVRHGGDRAGQVGGDLPALTQKAQETAQGRDHQLRPAATDFLSVTENEPIEVLWTQLIEPQRTVTEVFGKKAPNGGQVIGQRRRREPTLRGQELPVIPLETIQWGVVDRLRGRSDNAEAA